MKNDLDELVCRLKQHDKEAFNLLYYMYAEKIFKFSLTFFSNEAEAEEVVQEVFLKIWLKRETITDPTTFNAFTYTIAKNLIFNNLKRINIFYKQRRKVFLLSRMEGLKNREIAEQLDISLKTVETHMSLTLKHLRSTLQVDVQM